MPSDKDREEARKVLGNLTITVSANIGPFGKTKTIDFPQTDEVVESTARIIARIRAEAKAEVAYDSHVLYKTGDTDAPSEVTEWGLSICRNCGRGEIELEQVCDHRRVKAEALREAGERGREIARIAAYVEQVSEDEGYDIVDEVKRIRQIAAILTDEPTEKGE